MQESSSRGAQLSVGSGEDDGTQVGALKTVDPNHPSTSLVADEDDAISSSNLAVDSSSPLAREASLTTSDYEYQYTHGRRYHSNKDAVYGLPNDEKEQDRLDRQHRIFVTALDGRLFLAPLPVEKLQNVLDVGCGTGRWCIDLAHQVPEALVQGFDISPVQVDSLPPNCKFYVDDCNTEWQKPGRFNLIHTRALTLGVKDWSRFFRQAYDALAPGGFIECQEYLVPFHCKDTSTPETLGLVEWSRYVGEGVAKMGYDLAAAAHFERLLNDSGFQDVTVKYQDWPVGAWAKGARNKTLGRLTAENFNDGIHNSIKMFTGLLGWTEADFHAFAKRTTDEIDCGKFHLWTRVYSPPPSLNHKL